MSFDVLLYHFKNGEPAPANRIATKEYLKDYKLVLRNHGGNIYLTHEDGTEFDIEISITDLENEAEEFNAVSFNLHGLSLTVCNFIFGLALAGELVIVNPQSGPTFILNEKTTKLSDLPEGIEDEEFPIISSGKELYTLLIEGYEAWVDYKNKIIFGKS